MSADGVVKHLNVAKHIAACFLPGGIDVLADAFSFKQLEEAFCHSVVVAVAPPAHTGLQVVTGHEPLPLVARKLATLVGMNNDALAWSSAPDGHVQGIQWQLGVNAATG